MGSGQSKRTNTEDIKDLIDEGSILPVGLYAHSTTKDFDLRQVQKLIIDRYLAPFYKGVEDEIGCFPKNGSAEVSCLGGNARLHDAVSSPCAEDTSTGLFEEREITLTNLPPSNTLNDNTSASPTASKSLWSSLFVFRPKVNANISDMPEKIASRPSIDIWSKLVECPICFLFYPANINRTRCCNQPICTECFLQIRRPPTGQSAVCPYCVVPNFGIIYEAPVVQKSALDIEDKEINVGESNQRTLKPIILEVTTDMIRPYSTRSEGQLAAQFSSHSRAHRQHHHHQYSRRYGPSNSSSYRPHRHTIGLSHMPTYTTESFDPRLPNASPSNSQYHDLNNALQMIVRRNSELASQLNQRRRNFANIEDVAAELEELMLRDAIRQSLVQAGESPRMAAVDSTSQDEAISQERARVSTVPGAWVSDSTSRPDNTNAPSSNPSRGSYNDYR